eukprot:693434-Pelagomonas_calceolata.AAC.2
MPHVFRVCLSCGMAFPHERGLELAHLMLLWHVSSPRATHYSVALAHEAGKQPGRDVCWTPLASAARRGNTQIVQILVNHNTCMAEAPKDNMEASSFATKQ